MAVSKPIISIIVPTKNSAATLEACLASICAQTYDRLELIVVDNHSTDATPDIAHRFTSHVYTQGPERSAQRNFGVARATGQYVAIIDSDMELSPSVIAQCVQAAQDPAVQGVIIPEQSFGAGFWAQCKRLERSFYIGNDAIEAARFFPRTTYLKLGGYNESLVSGEDWDLSRRAAELGPLARITALIHHNEGRLSLVRTLQKKFYYARRARAYLQASRTTNALTADSGPLARYKLFFSRPATLLRHPFLAFGMLFMKTCEYAAGAVGYLRAAGKNE